MLDWLSKLLGANQDEKRFGSAPGVFSTPPQVRAPQQRVEPQVYSPAPGDVYQRPFGHNQTGFWSADKPFATRRYAEPSPLLNVPRLDSELNMPLGRYNDEAGNVWLENDQAPEGTPYKRIDLNNLPQLPDTPFNQPIRGRIGTANPYRTYKRESNNYRSYEL